MKKLISSLLCVITVFSSMAFTAFADTSSGLSGFVTRLYEVCLDRSPDAAGFEYWTSNLSSGTVSGSQAAEGFVFSDEFQNKNLSDSAYVTCMYEVLLGRTPDSTGLSYWTSRLTSDLTRRGVFDGFVDSDEWKAICEIYGINPGSSSSSSSASSGVSQSKIEAFVTRLYSGFLGRDPDSAGLASWTKKLANGDITGKACAYGFMHSDEFMSRYTSMSQSELITVFYKTFLGRTPSEAEIASHASTLTGDSGENLVTLFTNFSGSSEFASLCKSAGITLGNINPRTGKPAITDADVTEFFNNSMLIGSSTTVGFNLYFNAYGRGLMGNILVCARTSYSLLNDQLNRTNYIPMLNGVPMQAKYLIKNSGVNAAFICMGTNDICDGCIQRYQNYLDEIRELNPYTILFVESCPPTRGKVDNSDIYEFNAAMRDYCATHENIYYIDIHTPLMGSDGKLRSEYCSDGGVHLTYAGYKVWCDTLISYVREYLTENA